MRERPIQPISAAIEIATRALSMGRSGGHLCRELLLKSQRFRQIQITEIDEVAGNSVSGSPRKWAYNQSPEIDIPATKMAPNVITSTNASKLAAHQRNPFICQVQMMQEASDP
jgi:hypothetical protein